MQPRREQPVISIRSERARRRLSVLTRTGRSQVEVIEEALDRMPDPPVDEVGAKAERRARIMEILDRIPTGAFPSMAEFDAAEYDEFGLPR